jgi:hypothetical protein
MMITLNDLIWWCFDKPYRRIGLMGEQDAFARMCQYNGTYLDEVMVEEHINDYRLLTDFNPNENS